MKDIDRLKRLNMMERLGFLIKRIRDNPLKFFAFIAAFILILSLILYSPQLILLSKQSRAESYIEKSEPALQTLQASIENTHKTLEGYRKLFKEFAAYSAKVSDYKTECESLYDELGQYKARLEEKDVEVVLEAFSHSKDENKERELFPDKLKRLEEKLSAVSSEINEIIKLDAGLKNVSARLTGYYEAIPDEYTGQDDMLRQMLKNGKNPRVKDKSKELFQSIAAGKDQFVHFYQSISGYSAQEEGKFSLHELRNIEGQQKKALELYETFRTAQQGFDAYWKELQEQYYTVVSSHKNRKSVDRIDEPNPDYREWTETETYEDYETRYKTETYTERVYVGSRIVGDTKEDIYEDRTMTRQVPYQERVTKTRQVTKNNGRPTTITVPYEVYDFYYTVEMHKPGEVFETDKHAGKKHSKYDSSITTWNYKKDQEVGYIVWKQKWNDYAGLLEGKNLKAYFE